MTQPTNSLSTSTPLNPSSTTNLPNNNSIIMPNPIATPNFATTLINNNNHHHWILILCLIIAIITANAIATPTTNPTTEFIDSHNMSLALTKTPELPVLFLSHAAPVLLMNANESMLGRKNDSHFKSAVANWYRQLPAQLGLTKENKPKFIVQFSAHYENRGPIKVLGQDTYKGLLYDYYGFPAHTYDVQYPAAGSLGLAKLIVEMLTNAKIPAEVDTERSIDHGGFIPLLLMYPEADIPVLQLSITPNAALQRTIGEVLAPLRKNGVLFMGSGQATHGSFQPSANDVKQQELFVKAFTQEMLPADWTSADGKESYQSTTAGKSADEIYNKRAKTVDNWKSIVGAQYAHPHYDHYMPMAGCQGATKHSENQNLNIVGDHWLIGIHSLRSFVWGEYPYKGGAVEQENEADAIQTKKDEL